MVRQAIEDANTQFMEAIKRGDAASVAALYTEDAKLLPAGSEMGTGKQAIQAFWESALKMGVRSLTLETLDIGYEGDLAYEIGTYSLDIQPEGGQATTDRGKYVTVRKRQPDGSWKLVADIWNSDSPPPGQ